MPELPDVTIYCERLTAFIGGQPLVRARIRGLNLLRTYEPPVSAAEGRTVVGVRRMGKRILWEFQDGLFFVFHLMIAGRMRWRKAGVKLSKQALAAFEFPDGAVLLTEASKKKRASLHVVVGEEALAPFARSGVEVFDTDAAGFRAALIRENRTLKRALTDPHIISGIGNAYSDEILHRAQLSPLKRSRDLDDEGHARLYAATREVLEEWITRLREQVGDGFPDKVTAFRPEMAVHGRYGEPCPRCEAAVQRIRYADKECNYCPTCQLGGKLLRDRSLSLLLKGDWPKTLEELEERKKRGRRRS